MKNQPSKIQNKIEKLLALAKSSNPFEAKRAQTQAEALIKKLNGRDMFEDMMIIKSKNTIKSTDLNQSDFNILSSICAVTGTKHTVFETYKELQPLFAGHHQDVEKAAYLYDSITDQLSEKKKTLAVQLTTKEVEFFCLSFANSVNTKLYEAFGFNTCDEYTTAFAINQFGRDKLPIKRTQKPLDAKNPIEKACSWTGFRAGESVDLTLPEKMTQNENQLYIEN